MHNELAYSNNKCMHVRIDDINEQSIGEIVNKLLSPLGAVELYK